MQVLVRSILDGTLGAIASVLLIPCLCQAVLNSVKYTSVFAPTPLSSADFDQPFSLVHITYCTGLLFCYAVSILLPGKDLW